MEEIVETGSKIYFEFWDEIDWYHVTPRQAACYSKHVSMSW